MPQRSAKAQIVEFVRDHHVGAKAFEKTIVKGHTTNFYVLGITCFKSMRIFNHAFTLIREAGGMASSIFFDHAIALERTKPKTTAPIILQHVCFEEFRDFRPKKW